jgi:hypothetical protein
MDAEDYRRVGLLEAAGGVVAGWGAAEQTVAQRLQLRR